MLFQMLAILPLAGHAQFVGGDGRGDAVGNMPCPSPATISYPASSYCTSSSPVSPTITGNIGGIFHSTAGLSINAVTGLITPATSAGGSYVVFYTSPVDAFCPGVNATFSITIGPEATVGGPQTICAGKTTNGLGGNVPGMGAGTWSVESGGSGIFLPNNSTPNATFTHLTGTGPVILRWTHSNAQCGTTSADVSVTINPAPTMASAGGPQAMCFGGTTSGLQGNAPGIGTAAWSIVSGGTGVFNPDATTPNATFTHYTGVGPLILGWTTTLGSCMDTASVTVSVDPVAKAHASGPYFSGGPGTVPVFATANGPGSWSGGTGTFASPTIPNTTYTLGPGEANSEFTIIWTTNAIGSCPASASSTAQFVAGVYLGGVGRGDAMAPWPCPTATDTDSDGILDCVDNCPSLPGQQGSPCDDGDPNTINDFINTACACAGTPIPPPSNDAVCNAVPLTCGDAVLGTTIGATNSGTGEGDACGTPQSMPGVWYQVTGNGSLFTASLCNTAWDSKLSVYEGSCASLSCIGGMDDNGPSCASAAGAASYAWMSTIGIDYYIKVHGYGSNSDFQLDVACAPANDLVCNAAAIVCGSTVQGTTIGAGNSGIGEDDYCDSFQTSPGVWYQVSGTGGLFSASLCNTTWDSKLSVYAGSCASLTCVGGNDDNGPACSSASASYSWISTPGTMYYIKVHGYNTVSDFELGLTCAPLNDAVCNATPVTCSSSTSGTTLGATMAGTGEGDVCGFSQTQPGVWYSIVGNGQIIRADLCGTAWDSKLSVYTGTCSSLTCLGGIDDDGPACTGLSASGEWPSTVGETYFIKVHGYSSNSAFDLVMSCFTPPTGVNLAVNTVLEGPYAATSGLMDDDLRTLPSFPLAQPYSATPFLYGGAETVAPSVLAVVGNDAIVDWVLVELRDANTPATILATRAALLQRDGDVVDTDGISSLNFGLTPGSYHVAILHRNHLGVMTASPVALSAVPATVDFTTLSTATYGTDARKSIAGAVSVQALWAGDVTSNGTIKYTGAANDRDPILQIIGGTIPTNTASGYLPEDVNLDGVAKYTGGSNDRDPILQNIGGAVPTNSRTQQLP